MEEKSSGGKCSCICLLAKFVAVCVQLNHKVTVFQDSSIFRRVSTMEWSLILELDLAVGLQPNLRSVRELVGKRMLKTNYSFSPSQRVNYALILSVRYRPKHSLNWQYFD